MTHVVLVGLMGTGKSAVGALVAQRLGRRFVDNDAVLEERTGSSAAAHAERSGADELHERELAALAATLGRTPGAVVGAAASVADHDDSAALLAPHTVVWLTADPEVLAERVAGSDHRPFVGGEDPADVLRAQATRRDPAYAALADVTVDTTQRTPDEVAAEVVAAVGQPESGRPA